MFVAYQDTPNPLPMPEGNVPAWMLWVMASAVVVMAYAIYRMFLKFTEDKAALLAEVQKAKADAVTQLDAARERVEDLHGEIAKLSKELGVAQAMLTAARETIDALKRDK